MPERDLFANFERMRREMDELFGDVFDRALGPRNRGGFSPAVDVFYEGDPPRAVVHAELAGIDPDEIGRESVPLPDTLTPLAVGQDRSVQLVNDVLAGNRMLVMVASKDPEQEAPGPDALYEVGVVGSIARMMKVPDGTLRILVQGAQRVHIDDWARETPYIVAQVSELPDIVVESTELTALVRNVQQTFSEIVELLPY